MRTRFLVIGAFLCAAVLPAVLAASAYAQARHIPCRWSADYCSPLDNLIFAGAVMRGCVVALTIVGVTRGALVYWRWHLNETLHWSVILVEGTVLILGIAIIWALSQVALDIYIQVYNSVPAGPAKDSREALILLNQANKAMSDFYWLGRALAILTGLAVVACADRIWKSFDVQQRHDKGALQFKYLLHKH